MHGVPFGSAQGRLSSGFGWRLTALRMTGERVVRKGALSVSQARQLLRLMALLYLAVTKTAYVYAFQVALHFGCPAGWRREHCAGAGTSRRGRAGDSSVDGRRPHGSGGHEEYECVESRLAIWVDRAAAARSGITEG